MSIIKKIEENCLIGRGGAGFPVHIKWKSVAKAKSKNRYLVINGAEGEPGIHKDGHIINNLLEELSLGAKIAADYIKAKKIYFYLNSKYYNTHKDRIHKVFKKNDLAKKIELIEKPKDSGYIGGEESTVINIIEGKRPEPRLKPPFPTERGLFMEPTLVNNVETLYNVYLVSKNKYENKRFYSINFGRKNKGVYFLSDDFSIKKILQETNNYPEDDFFVQAGGDASGEVLNQYQLGKKVGGAGSITIHNLKDHDPVEMIKYWLGFFKKSSCGQCTPCREGTYRLLEIFRDKSSGMIREDSFLDICKSLSFSSFCALGTSAPIAVETYFKNIYKKI
jgi:NADH:ubiquinone oxidoreductase subunit F (NADH-binding)